MGILVLKMKVLKIISRFCATVSTFGFSLMIILNTHTHSCFSSVHSRALRVGEPSESERGETESEERLRSED